jgi:UDP-glucose 4-epimerase
VEVVVHLAAAVGGDEDAQFAATVGGTERLVSAMAAAGVPRLVLASSFAVYDWERIRDRITEESPLVTEARDLDRRGGYTVAKVWQERVARRAADEHGMGLTVLRPGFVWAAGKEPFAGVGPAVGGVHVVIGPTRPLPLTYAENCADCFAQAIERPAAIGQTLNVIDDEDLSAWRFMREYVRRVPEGGHPVPMPYAAARTAAELAQLVSRTAFGEGGRLPSILTPAHFAARFKPLRFSAERVRSVLGWQPPWTLEAAMDRTYGTAGSAPSRLA